MTRKSSPRRDDSQRDELLWLETYFIAFPARRRPTLAQVERALAEADPHLKLENLSADDDGLFQSLLVESPGDHAAVEVSYETGDAVVEQNMQWAKQLQKQLTPKQLEQLVGADARLDVAHYERVPLNKPGIDGASRAEGVRHAEKQSHNPDDQDYETSDAYDDELADSGGGDDFDVEAAMETFDPTCLLTVVDSLAALTRGITLDAAAGEVV